MLLCILLTSLSAELQGDQLGDIYQAQIDRFSFQNLTYSSRMVSSREFYGRSPDEVPPTPEGMPPEYWAKAWKAVNAPKTVSTQSLQMSDTFFRSVDSVDYPESDLDGVETTTAFDGEHIQRRTSASLSVRDGMPQGKENYSGSPLAVLEPFLFATRVLRRALRPEDIKSEQTWLALKDVSRVLGVEELDGSSLTVVEVYVPGASLKDIVYFDPDQGWFPVRSDCFNVEDGTSRLVSRSTADPVRFDVGRDQPIYLADTVLKELFDQEGRRIATLKTDISDLTVDEPIRESVFTLSPAGSKHYFDEDHPELSFSNDIDYFVRAVVSGLSDSLEPERSLPADVPASVLPEDPNFTPLQNDTGSIRQGVFIWLAVGLGSVAALFVIFKRARGAKK